MQVAGLDAELDGVAFIDGLDPSDRSQYQDTSRLQNLIRSIEPRFLGPTYMCDNSHHYFQALADLTSRAKAGSRFLLHFECHGYPDGLFMGADEVLWNDQAPPLSKLNNATNGQLVLDLSACNGIYATKMAGLNRSPVPFYAVIGPAKTVAMNCAAVITEAFYRAYLGSSNGQLDAAIRAANRKLGLDVVKGIRAEAFAALDAQGYPFRPNARDDETVACRPDGTVYVQP